MPGRRSLALALLIGALLLLHQLGWLVVGEGATARWLGLPAGLAYHVGYCLLAAAGLALAIRLAWPAALIDDAETSADAAEAPAATLARTSPGTGDEPGGGR